jgi:genome maintenance exonuclease 1
MQRNLKKFLYQPLSRESIDGARLYDTPTGKLPSVTTILSATQSEDSKQGLAAWRERVGEQQALAITTEAANVGTIMHEILEHWLLGTEYNPGNNMIHRQAKIMADVIKKNIEPDISEIWGCEVNLYYPELYAGTSDVLGVYKGKPTIMDFKQANKPKKREWISNYFHQGTAYGAAHNEVYGTSINSLGIFVCTRAGEFQLFDAHGDEFDHYAVEWAQKLEEYYSL